MLVAILAVAMAACGGGSSTGSRGAGPGGGPDEAGGGEVAGTVRYAAAGFPTAATYDPHGLLPGESDVTRMALVYDVLTLPGDDGGTQPRLAVSWTPDDALTTWTVEIRDDATFTDGRELTAEDVLYSLRRMGEKKAENFGRMSMFDLEGSSVVDDTTLELRTVKAYAEVGTALQGATFIVPAGSNDFSSGTVAGSGPFMVRTSDTQVTVLGRNDDWWGPTPATETIELRTVADAQARSDAVRSGQADLAGAVPPTAVESLGDDDSIQVITRPGATTYPLVMRTDTAPFNEPRVREAIKMSLDREQLLQTVFLGYGQVGNDLLTPNDPTSPNDLEAPGRDVAGARDLLGQAGSPDGLDVTLTTTNAYPGMDSAATLIASQLQEAGIRVTIDNAPADTYFSEVYGQSPFYVSYLGGIPFLDVARVALAPGAPTNETAWDDPEWSAALDRALAEPDEAARHAELARLQADLADRGGYAVWAMSDRLDLAVEGISGLPTGIGFSSAFIDQVKLVR